MPRLTTKSRRHYPVLLDPLEPRQHLTATPDLALTNLFVAPATDVEPGGSLWAGAQTTVPANLPANATFKVFLSADTTLSPDDIVVTSVAVTPYNTSYPVPPIFSLNIPSDAAPGQYHVIGIIDADNAIAESDETNNAFVAGNDITVHAPADASSYVPRFTSVDVAAPFPDRNFPVGARGVNVLAYLADFNDFYHVPVSVYASADGTAGNADDILIGTGTATRSGFGNEGYAAIAATLNLAPGTYHLVAVAGGVSYVGPSTFTVTANNTDLALTSASLPTAATPGSNLSLNLSFSINSPAPSNYNGIFDVTYVLSTDDTLGNADDILVPAPNGTPYHQHFAGVPGPGLGDLFVFPDTDFTQSDYLSLPADLAPGTYHLFAIADPNNVIAEANETNNVHRGPDLTITDLATDAGQTPAPVAPVARVARSTRASLTLQNPGKSAGTYVVRLYLSDDPKLSRNDTLFSKQSVTTTLRPGKRSTLSLSYTLPPKTKLGTHFLIAVADAVTPQRSSASRAPVSTTTTATHFHTTTQIDVINPKKAKKNAHQALLS